MRVRKNSVNIVTHLSVHKLSLLLTLFSHINTDMPIPNLKRFIWNTAWSWKIFDVENPLIPFSQDRVENGTVFCMTGKHTLCQGSEFVGYKNVRKMCRSFTYLLPLVTGHQVRSYVNWQFIYLEFNSGIMCQRI